MDFEDDLLGGPSPSKSADPLDDELFGGTVSQKGPAFDDDLLFGGGGDVPPPKSAAPASQSAPAGMIVRKFPPTCAVITACTAVLTPYVQPKTYFVRFVTQYDPVKDRRTRKVLTVDADDITVYTDEKDKQTVERKFPVHGVTGIIGQQNQVAKRIGKEWEQHYLIQIKGGEPDFYFSLHRDDMNGTLAQDFTSVVSSVASSFGIVLPVSSLRNNEKLNDLYYPHCGADDRLRQAFHETLAFRTELLEEYNNVSKEESTIDMNIANIKASPKGQDAAGVKREIDQVQGLIDQTEGRRVEVKAERKQAEEEIAHLREELRKEAERRENAAAESAEEHAQQQLLKRVAEYEVQLAAHTREMDLIKNLTQFYERRQKERTASTYDMKTMSLRIDDLEDQLEFVKGKTAEKGEAHSKRLKALTENRRRKALCIELVKELKEEVTTIEKAPLEETLSTKIQSLELPDIDPVIPAKEPSAAPAATPAKQHQDPQPPAEATSAKKPIVLDDSPEDVPIKPSAAPKPVVDLDDDDI